MAVEMVRGRVRLNKTLVLSRVERQHALIEELRRFAPRSVTGSRLAGRLGVSRRTVERDAADLVEAGVPITVRRGTGGGYMMDGRTELPPIAFTPGEAAAVVASMVGVGPFVAAPLSPPSARSWPWLLLVPPRGLRDAALDDLSELDSRARDMRSSGLEDRRSRRSWRRCRRAAPWRCTSPRSRCGRPGPTRLGGRDRPQGNRHRLSGCRRRPQHPHRLGPTRCLLRVDRPP